MNSQKKINNAVFTEKYDLAGNRILRVTRLALLARFVPMGNLAGGPGARCLLVLFSLHTFGAPLYQLYARYGEKLGWLKKRFKKRV